MRCWFYTGSRDLLTMILWRNNRTRYLMERDHQGHQNPRVRRNPHRMAVRMISIGAQVGLIVVGWPAACFKTHWLRLNKESLVECAKSELTQHSFFVRFCFSMRKYALFRPHFHTSILPLSRLLHIDEKFVYEQWERYMKKSCAPSEKIFYRKTFVQYVTLWLVRIYKNADEKEHTFYWKEKKKKDKSGYCVNAA